MTLEELIDEVQNVIQDAVWTDAMITTLLNRGQLIVASGIILPGKYQLTPPLPALYTTGTVDTTLLSGVCSLPDDYNRSVVQILNADYETIKLYPSFRQFLTRNPEQEAGDVRACAIHGNRLLYRDIPATAETLTVHYYQNPTELEDDDDEPDCIPEILQKPLLVGYACSQIFNQIEDGIEGQKINTAFWNNEFQQGLINLGIYIGHDDEPDYYEDLIERVP